MKCPSCLATGAGTLTVSSALVSRSLALSSDDFVLISSAVFGVGGAVVLAAASSECRSVPWEALDSLGPEQSLRLRSGSFQLRSF